MATRKPTTSIAALAERIEHMQETIDKLVTRHEFDPVKMLVYGLVGSVLAGAVGALLSKIFVK
jgi:hemoglobin-like flavoprotein